MRLGWRAGTIDPPCRPSVSITKTLLPNQSTRQAGKLFQRILLHRRLRIKRELTMTYLSKLMTSFTAGMMLVAGQSLTAADRIAKLSTQDRKFILDAAKGGMMEVRM